jgi:hypothetical protein
MAQNSISSELNNLLITHDFDVDALSTKTGKPAVNERGVPDASEADMFSFDWVGPTGKNYGTMVILLDQNGGMTVYFGDNLGRTMDPEDKKAWYGDSETDSPGFLEQLKNFAIRTSKIRGGFGLENLSKLKYAIAGQAALTESFYGTRKVSYSGEPTDARLMIKHTRPITEGDKRYRYVESLFIETAEGERFRLPFRKLAGGRAMLEHVRQGGNPYDIRGQHIAETVNQLNVLSQFRRAHQGRVFEGAAGDLVTETDQYYQRLNHNLKHMASSRGYNRYFESWKPADISEGDIMVEDLRGMFVETRIDPRIESALPMLAKIQQEAKAMKEAEIFESWAARLVEGTWALPDTPEKMTQLQDWLSQERPLGPDAEDVTDVLYDLIGDDALFDQLAGMAEEDPSADAVPMVQAWITRNKDQSPELSELAMSFEPEAPPAAPAAPAAPAPAAQPVAEGVAEGRVAQLPTRGADYSKYDTDHLKMMLRPGILHRDEAKFKALIRKELQKREQQSQQGVAEGWDSTYIVSVIDTATGERNKIEVKVTSSAAAKKRAEAQGYKVLGVKEKGVKEGDLNELSTGLLKRYKKQAQRDIDTTDDAGIYNDTDIDRIGRRTTGITRATSKIKSNNKKEPSVAEGDNLQTFEDIVRLSGAPINENVLNDAGSTLDYIIKTYQRDIKDFVQNGDMSEHLYDALYDYYQDDMPYGIKKARSGDPFEWIGERFYNDLQGHGMMDEGWSIGMSPEEIQKGQDAVNASAQHPAPNPVPASTPAPVNECNYTALNEYCPVHGLEECYGTSMFESELARIKSLSSFK